MAVRCGGLTSVWRSAHGGQSEMRGGRELESDWPVCYLQTLDRRQKQSQDVNIPEGTDPLMSAVGWGSLHDTSKVLQGRFNVIFNSIASQMKDRIFRFRRQIHIIWSNKINVWSAVPLWIIQTSQVVCPYSLNQGCTSRIWLASLYGLVQYPNTCMKCNICQKLNVSNYHCDLVWWGTNI